MPVYTYTTLDDPSATNGTQAVGINDAGQIVGWYDNASGSNGFLYSGGTYPTLDEYFAQIVKPIMPAFEDALAEERERQMDTIEGYCGPWRVLVFSSLSLALIVLMY
jgi:probable HAF family extracellular repeat protein